MVKKANRRSPEIWIAKVTRTDTITNNLNNIDAPESKCPQNSQVTNTLEQWHSCVCQQVRSYERSRAALQVIHTRSLAGVLNASSLPPGLGPSLIHATPWTFRASRLRSMQCGDHIHSRSVSASSASGCTVCHPCYMHQGLPIPVAELNH